METAKQVLVDTVFAELGIKLDATRLTLGNEWTVVGEYDLNPRMFGPIGPAFQSCRVKIKAGFPDDGKVYILYNYNWRHSGGGSNGYVVERQINL